MQKIILILIGIFLFTGCVKN